MIPAKKFSSAELNDYCEIMRAGNSRLIAVSEQLGFDGPKEFRIKLFKSNPISLDGLKLNKTQKNALISAIPYIQKVRDIEWDMLCGYIRLVNKLAMRAKNIYRVPFEDCQQNGLMALLDCIYGYNGDCAFTTYAYSSIKNRLLNLRLDNNLMSNLTNRAVKLLSRYDSLKQEKMVAGFRYDEETIIGMMEDLSQKERKILKSALLSVATVHASVLSGNEDGEQSEDFTSLRRDINNAPDNELTYIRMAYDDTHLSTLEKEIVETFLCPYYGWQTNLARKTINPTTRKPYSNRGIAFLLEQALGKIRHTYVSKYGEIAA